MVVGKLTNIWKFWKSKLELVHTVFGDWIIKKKEYLSSFLCISLFLWGPKGVIIKKLVHRSVFENIKIFPFSGLVWVFIWWNFGDFGLQISFLITPSEKGSRRKNYWLFLSQCSSISNETITLLRLITSKLVSYLSVILSNSRMLSAQLSLSAKSKQNKTKDQLWSLNAAQPVGNTMFWIEF